MRCVPRNKLETRLTHQVKTRDLVCAVTSVLGIAAGALALSVVLRRRPEVDAPQLVLATGLFGAYCGTVSSVAGVPVGAFLGVPYADPRTLRFAAPIPWYRGRQTHDNTAPAPGCAQATPNLDGMNPSTSEDCLRLNIWSPSCTTYPCSGNRTVVVFIHGGFFQQTGSNNDPQYDGRVLAALGDVVVVVPNWRLGVLGFLSLTRSDGAPVNAGLLDQAEALRWTARNVEFFGGNKSDLVVVGHGSGASALGYHLMSGSGLRSVATIRRAVFMSESPMTRYPVYTDHQKEEEGAILETDILAELFCTQSSQNYSSLLECLRSIPVETLLKKPPRALRELPLFFPVLPVMWPRRTWEKLKIPRSTTVMLGFSDEEGAALLLFYYRSLILHEQRGLLEALLPILRLLGFSSHEAEAILDLYRPQVDEALPPTHPQPPVAAPLTHADVVTHPPLPVAAPVTYGDVVARPRPPTYYLPPVPFTWHGFAFVGSQPPHLLLKLQCTGLPRRPQHGMDSDLAEHLLSDLLSVCPTRLFAEQLRAWGNTVHGYVLHQADAGRHGGRTPWNYAVQLLFGSSLVHASPPAEQELSRHVIARWAHFFKTGEVKAEQYSTRDRHFVISMTPFSDGTLTWVPDLRREACEKLRPHFQNFIGSG
ncbi:cholinesterase-like [Amblyomma americanum]